MFNNIDFSFLNIVKLLISIILLIISIFIILKQYSPSVFPLTKKMKFWRASLIGIVTPVGVFAILLAAEVFHNRDLFQLPLLFILICLSIPASILNFISAYFGYDRLAKYYEKASIGKKDNNNDDLDANPKSNR